MPSDLQGDLQGDLQISMDRAGNVVLKITPRVQGVGMVVLLTPDEANNVAAQLNDAAEQRIPNAQ